MSDKNRKPNDRNDRRRPRRSHAGRWAALTAVIAVAGIAVFVGLRTFGRVEVSQGNSRPTKATSHASAGKETASPTQSPTQAPTQEPTRPADPARYVQPEGAPWNLILVNDYNPVPASYENSAQMVTVSGGSFDSRAADALRRMIQDGAVYSIRGVSLYRPKEQQERLYNNEVAKWQGQGYELEEARTKAATVVKPAGYSEHNCGLAADLGGSGNYSLEQNFENTEAFRWLKAHCAEYGFILRYPKDKEDITGVIYEPWHYRYVGVETATYIMENNLCLEEYLAQKGQ